MLNFQGKMFQISLAVNIYFPCDYIDFFFPILDNNSFSEFDSAWSKERERNSLGKQKHS